jgi:hypothetical protein
VSRYSQDGHPALIVSVTYNEIQPVRALGLDIIRTESG